MSVLYVAAIEPHAPTESTIWLETKNQPPARHLSRRSAGVSAVAADPPGTQYVRREPSPLEGSRSRNRSRRSSMLASGLLKQRSQIHPVPSISVDGGPTFHRPPAAVRSTNIRSDVGLARQASAASHPSQPGSASQQKKTSGFLRLFAVCFGGCLGAPPPLTPPPVQPLTKRSTTYLLTEPIPEYAASVPTERAPEVARQRSARPSAKPAHAASFSSAAPPVLPSVTAHRPSLAPLGPGPGGASALAMRRESLRREKGTSQYVTVMRRSLLESAQGAGASLRPRSPLDPAALQMRSQPLNAPVPSRSALGSGTLLANDVGAYASGKAGHARSVSAASRVKHAAGPADLSSSSKTPLQRIHATSKVAY